MSPTDEGGGLILGVAVTSVNVHDPAELAAMLPAEAGDVYGDSAFGGSRVEAIAALGGRARIVQTGTWRGPGGAGPLAAIQCRGVAGCADGSTRCWAPANSYGLRRMRWLGLAKAGLQVRLTAIAFNLRRLGWPACHAAPFQPFGVSLMSG